MCNHTTDEGNRTVEIPEWTAVAIADRLDDTEFDSVDDYVAFALGQLLRELDRADAAGRGSAGGERSSVDGAPDDDRASSDGVEDRLESLGYL